MVTLIIVFNSGVIFVRNLKIKVKPTLISDDKKSELNTGTQELLDEMSNLSYERIEKNVVKTLVVNELCGKKSFYERKSIDRECQLGNCDGL